MKFPFLISAFFFQTVLCQTTSAANWPKTAVAHLQLDQPPVRVQFPKMDLQGATMKADTGLVTFINPGNIMVGSASYPLADRSFVVLKEGKKTLELDNIKLIQYRLYSTITQKVVATITVNIEDSTATFNKMNVEGVVTEVWP